MIDLALIILVLAGLYTCIKREARVSSGFTIRGRTAEHIGLVLLIGGIAAAILPWFFVQIGLIRDFVPKLLFTIGICFASLGYVAILVVQEKRKQALPPDLPRNG